MIEEYEVRPDTLCNYYDAQGSTQISEVIAEFLMKKKAWKRIPDLYVAFKSRQVGLPEDPIFSYAMFYDEMIRQLREIPDITNAPEFNINFYYFYPGDLMGAILNQPIRVDRTDFPKMHAIFFAYIYQKTEWPEEFLRYQFEHHFNSDIKTFKTFMKYVQKVDADYLIVKDWRLWDHCMNDCLESWRDEKEKVTVFNIPPALIRHTIDVLIPKHKSRSYVYLIKALERSKVYLEIPSKSIKTIEHAFGAGCISKSAYYDYNGEISTDDRIVEELSDLISSTGMFKE